MKLDSPAGICVADIPIIFAQRAQITPEREQSIIAMCASAFDDDFARLFERRPGAIHGLAMDGDAVIGHLCWTIRPMRIEAEPSIDMRWIEAVAVRPELQGLGLGSRLMDATMRHAGGPEMFGLCAIRPSFYERLGWRTWTGPVTFQGAVDTGEGVGEPLLVWRQGGLGADSVSRGITIGERGPAI